MGQAPLALLVALSLTSGGATAQFANPGAYTSPGSAGSTAGFNLLFFGNSYTISSENPRVHTPSYGGARGVPELVRQIAIAAGHAPPFVKNVYHLNRGLDYHLAPSNPSLAHVDEPALDGETWDFVVLQGFSTRSTDHPYTGNPRLHQENSWRMFEEVRAGTTSHVSQHPSVVPMLYQTWARHPDHWFYDVSSSFTAGHNIAIGIAAWRGGPLFAGPAEMAEQVRTSYDEACRLIEARTPGAAPRIAPVGDAWEAADWGTGFANLYSSDYYHASSHGDLLTALTLYGTVYGDTNTSALVASGVLSSLLTAIDVDAGDAARLAAWADQALLQPPVPQPPQFPGSAILVDFSGLAGVPTGPEQRPVVGRYYNTISDPTAGGIADCVDTENRPTGVSVQIVDAFPGDTAGGANGGFISAVNLTGSLYEGRAQLDSFYVGLGAGFTDAFAAVELQNLDPAQRYDLVIYGSRESFLYPPRIGHYSIPGIGTRVLDASHNMNLVASFLDVPTDTSGRLRLEVTNGGRDPGFAYLGMLELRKSARLTGGGALSPGQPVTMNFQAPAHPGGVAVTGVSLGLGPTLYGPHLLRADMDPLFGATFGRNSAVLLEFLTALDGSGTARPSIALPPVPGLRGLTMHATSLVADAGAPGGVAVVSNPWSLRVR
ncbi:MAG: hypothetical protein AAF628_14075 [Planctomycetota bacterium]